MKLLYFAWIRTKLGVSEELMDVPPDIKNVKGLIDWLINQGDAYKTVFSDLSLLRVAVNQEYASSDSPVKAGDEVALFPPVTGG